MNSRCDGYPGAVYKFQVPEWILHLYLDLKAWLQQKTGL